MDASERSLAAAVADGADLLLVHHGLFWDSRVAVTGRRHRRLSLALANGLAVYAAHLPLDVHPEVGNNFLLARALGVELRGTFGSYRGEPLGRWGELEVRREALAARLDELLGGPVRMIAGGPERIQRIGVVTGSGADLIADARDAGLDTLVTGEGAHHTFFDATEEGVNLYLGGHYATETFGVRALAAHLEERFGLPWRFLDQPTGL